jgi:hypothetical protein
MLNRTLQLSLAGCLISGSLWAADNPFVGKWKVNPSKNIRRVQSPPRPRR